MHRLVFMMVAVGITTISLAWCTPARATNEATQVAEHLIELVKIGREVVSEHQATINDATKAEKGFTADFVADQVSSYPPLLFVFACPSLRKLLSQQASLCRRLSVTSRSVWANCK